MLFCPKCGSIMKPKEEGRKAVLECSCGYRFIEKDHILMKENIRMQKKISIIDERDAVAMPKLKEECPKCGNFEAYFWTMQTRAGDEAETRFFQCVKCGHRWRLYK
ncbi:transcription factor S [archaeon]|nr:transcription factor S [archaeon]